MAGRVLPRLLALTCIAGLAGAAPAGESPRDADIEFTTGYWSQFVHFSPAPVEPKLLAGLPAADPEGFGKEIARHKIDLGKPFVGWPFYHAVHRRLEYLIQSPEMPAGWTDPDFDDSSWPRHREPLFTGRTLWASQAAGAICFRARFTVPDPGRVSKFSLEITYRGGAIVYVNGREVGRGHLPAGEPAPTTPAQVYPAEAYVLPPVRIGEYDSKGPRVLPELWSKFPGPTKRIRDDAEKLKKPIENLTSIGKHGRGAVITRAEWERVRSLRERRLGPLEVPANLLRKGTNVLAVRIQRSYIRPDQKVQWLHCYLSGARARCQPPGSVLAETRPAGLQVWTEDIHRRPFARDFGPAGGIIRPVRIVAARGGAFSGQVLIGSGARLAGLKASVGDLSGPGGASLPASAVQVRYGRGHGASGLGELTANAQGGRGLASVSKSLIMLRYAPDAKMPEGLRSKQVRAWRAKVLSEVLFYDHLTPAAPAELPADSCLPVWVTVNVPAGAAPGGYRGKLSISAGGRRAEVPVRLWVMGWKLPAPGDFSTVMAIEPSPYGVARHYQVEPWSDRHFQLMENTFRLLGQVGNDMVVIPVLLGTEFGNGDDSMLRWKKAGGGYACDFSILGRFLAMVRRHGHPRCVSFVVCHSPQGGGPGRDKPQILLAGGKPLDVPPPGSAAALALWKPFVAGLRKELAGRDLAGSLHWGYLGDTMRAPANATVEMFGKIAPGVGWARGAHGWSKEGSPYSFGTTVRMSGTPINRAKRIESQKGWQRTWMKLVFTRVENATANVYGFTGPIRYRQAPEAALTAGSSGIGRWGADYWAGSYRCWGNVSPTVLSLFWPGPAGAESGARFEILREGMQQAEARVFLEKKLEGKSYAAGAEGKAVQAMLDRRIAEYFVQVVQSADNCPQPKIEEYYYGWQPDSWDLYAAAARAAGARAPGEGEKARFFGPAE
jgi:hypothetical protein